MRFNSIFIFIFICSLLTSCIGVPLAFIPKKQDTIIKTNNEEASVFVEKEKIGKGKEINKRIMRRFGKQVVVQAPNYKDTYYVISPTRRPHSAIAKSILAIPFFYLPGLMPNNVAHEKIYTFTPKTKLQTKGINDKFIDISAIKVNIAEMEKDISGYRFMYTHENLLEEIKKEEAKKLKNDKKIEDKKNKKKPKKQVEYLNEEEKSLTLDNTKFTTALQEKLKKGGFIDTTNNILNGNFNVLNLEGKIVKVYFYEMQQKYKIYSTVLKSKLKVIWQIKNEYGEAIDSIQTEEYSGEFVNIFSDDYIKVHQDAIETSFYSLFENTKFQKYLKKESVVRNSDPVLTLSKPKKAVAELTDANDASVIVKNKDSHGSGFAISTDGYILTNYHVISGDKIDKINEIKIILSDGTEKNAKVVRYNRQQDLALLKIEHTFEKAFLLTNTKSFELLQDIYTIGAPQTIDLGQSVSIGLISNERKSEFVNLIQLNLGVSPGNSGGPVFDEKGTLHGVVTSKLVGFGTEGVSFAIPSHLIADYLNIKF